MILTKTFSKCGNVVLGGLVFLSIYAFFFITAR